ncbi:MAG: hypothetical protein ABIX28_18740, partial [Vicinamibacterales bacterium]
TPHEQVRDRRWEDGEDVRCAAAPIATGRSAPAGASGGRLKRTGTLRSEELLSPYRAQTDVWQIGTRNAPDVKVVTKETKMGSMYEAAAVVAAHALSSARGPRDGRPVASEFGVGAKDLSDLRVDLEKSAGRG